MEKMIFCIIFLGTFSISLLILNTREIYKSRKYRNEGLKSDNKLSFVSVPSIVNDVDLQLLSLFIRATKVDTYKTDSMDEWYNNFKGFTLHFDDKSPLNVIYLKNVGVNIYDAKTDKLKHVIPISNSGAYNVDKVMDLICEAYSFYTERKDKDVWN